WVPANESFGLGEVDTAVRDDFLVRLYRMTHELDASRPVVSNDGWEHALTDLCTLHDYSTAPTLVEHFRSVDAALTARAEGHETYDPGFSYRGEPMLVTEFGGLRFKGSTGWGYHEVGDSEQLVQEYEARVAALMQPGPVYGFCYTQLTDVEQEQNGLAAADRTPKADPSRIRPITQVKKKEGP
ncbi:MAG TPA: glycoside hydrolase family 2, partial [Candidatus Dormibacteraeota bacterium]|nr:glycoside hydrolase family 2 [Candidatus Dormibacteraeota bacterium]